MICTLIVLHFTDIQAEERLFSSTPCRKGSSQVWVCSPTEGIKAVQRPKLGPSRLLSEEQESGTAVSRVTRPVSSRGTVTPGDPHCPAEMVSPVHLLQLRAPPRSKVNLDPPDEVSALLPAEGGCPCAGTRLGSSLSQPCGQGHSQQVLWAHDRERAGTGAWWAQAEDAEEACVHHLPSPAAFQAFT